MFLSEFKTLIKEGVFSVMVGHLEVPALEKVKGRPSSLSFSIVTDLLKKEFGFKGLVVTDALNMKGVSDYSGNESASLGSFLAGADLLLIPDEAPNGRYRRCAEFFLGTKSVRTSIKRVNPVAISFSFD